MNTHYTQDLGTIITDGWTPSGESWAQYARGLLKWLGEYREIGNIVNKMLSDTTFAAGLYAYDASMRFVKTRVFLYVCGSRYQVIRWESTTVKKIRFVFKESDHISYEHLNLIIPGSKSALETLVDSWDSKILGNILDDLSGN